jgi:acetyltransferase-like isoleucine patch superfamily enzyme
MQCRTLWEHVSKNPGSVLVEAVAVVRGQYYRLKFRLLGRRVVVGRRFRVIGRLDIRGPGTVIFGDDCMVFSTRIAPTTPWTQSAEAVIRFGNQVALNGTRLSCVHRIEVGDATLLADARITDTDFHAIETNGQHRLKTPGATKAVIIGRNAWVCMGAILLKGVRIGDNAVVAAGAVVTGYVPSNVIVFGNPARVVWRMRGTDTGSSLSGDGRETSEVLASDKV